MRDVGTLTGEQHLEQKRRMIQTNQGTDRQFIEDKENFVFYAIVSHRLSMSLSIHQRALS
jgi:hypothetical protein